MLIAEHFIHSLVKKYGKRPVSTDGGTWYPQACRFLKLQRHIHSLYEKSIIERIIQYVKDRTESFDDYFQCTKLNANCNILEIGLTYLLAVIIDGGSSQVNRAIVLLRILSMLYFFLFYYISIYI